MAYDMYGRWIPDDPNNAWNQRNRQNPPPGNYGNAYPNGYNGYNQPNPPGGYAYNQQPAGLTKSPEMYHADIVPINGERDVREDIVPPTGEPRVYMSRDERLMATKCVGPNGVEMAFYDRRPDAAPAQQLDPQNVVLRSELESLVRGIANKVIDERIAQTPVYEPPQEPAPSRVPAKSAGGKNA